MGTPHVVTALRSKREELAGCVDQLQDALRQAMIDLDHVEATLRLFDPEAAPEPLKHRLPPATKRAGAGEISRVVLGLLRTHGPMDGYALTRLVMTGRGQNPDDKPLFNRVHARIGTSLRGLRKREVVTSAHGPAGLLVWGVA